MIHAKSVSLALAMFCFIASGGASAQDAPAQAPLRLACRLANYGAYQDIALEHIRDMGLKYVFMSIPKPEEAAGVLEKMQELGLEVLVVRGDVNLSEEGSAAALGVQLETCRQLGVHYMFLSPKRHDAPKEVIFDRLRQAGDLAAKCDVVIALETHPDLGTNAELHLETMRAINHPNIRVNIDTANLSFYNHDVNAVEELKKCIDFVATVEVKDHNGEFESWNFPALGEGIVDFPGVFRALRERGYSGPVTIEVEGVKGVEWSQEETKQAMEKSIAYLRGIESFK